MRILIFCWITLFFASCVTSKKSGIVGSEFKMNTGKVLPYNIIYPRNYGKEKLPLLVWLHGAGERGDDNVSPLIHCVPYIGSDLVQSKYPGIVLAPQCAQEDYWAPIKRTEWTIINGGAVTPSMEAVIALIDKMLKDPNIDKNRVYVGGLSMGGFGTYDLLSRRPEWFAGAVPICGGADLEKVNIYKDIPMWVFHGTKDMAVSVQLSRDLISALQKVGGNPKYTEYPEGGHDVWNKTIREPELWKWLFGQQKK